MVIIFLLIYPRKQFPAFFAIEAPTLKDDPGSSVLPEIMSNFRSESIYCQLDYFRQANAV